MQIRDLMRRAVAAGMVAALLVAAPPASADAPDAATYVPAGSRQSVASELQTLGFGIGSIRIPAIGLEDDIRAGVDLSVIDQGVAHWVGTAQPGEVGNMVLAGHRTTYSRPFHDLDRLLPGDVVFVTATDGREVMYRVARTFVVEPEDVWITYDNGTAQLTMFACHPKGSARYRIVVQAELIGGGRIG